MITLVDITQEAKERERARTRVEAEMEAERIKREARRRDKLQRCLASFDYEISFESSGAAAVGIKHPRRENTWLGFIVDKFDANDEPVFPDRAREIRIRAGQVFEKTAYLPLAAAEYVIKPE